VSTQTLDILKKSNSNSQQDKKYLMESWIYKNMVMNGTKWKLCSSMSKNSM